MENPLRTRTVTEPRRKYHHGDLRQALLGSALTLLEEDGPSALTLREIARRVGVSAPAAYHYYPSLDAIAVGLAEQGFRDLLQVLHEASTDHSNRLMPAGEAYVAFARRNPGLYRLMFGEGLLTSSNASGQINGMRRSVYEFVAENLKKRLPESQVAVATLFLWSLIHGLTLLLIDGQLSGAVDPGSVIRDVLRLAGTGIPASNQR